VRALPLERGLDPGDGNHRIGGPRRPPFAISNVGRGPARTAEVLEDSPQTPVNVVIIDPATSDMLADKLVAWAAHREPRAGLIMRFRALHRHTSCMSAATSRRVLAGRRGSSPLLDELALPSVGVRRCRGGSPSGSADAFRGEPATPDMTATRTPCRAPTWGRAPAARARIVASQGTLEFDPLRTPIGDHLPPRDHAVRDAMATRLDDVTPIIATPDHDLRADAPLALLRDLQRDCGTLRYDVARNRCRIIERLRLQ
jgi:hypothetical protein